MIQKILHYERFFCQRILWRVNFGNFVGKFYDGQSVRGDDNRFLCGDFFYQREDFLFGGGGQTGCRFVEQKYRRIFQQSTNNSEALKLSAA